MDRLPTLAEAIDRLAEAPEDRGFVFQDQDGRERFQSFRRLESETARLAAVLAGAGLQAGDRLGMVMIEPAEFVPAFLAAVRAGAVPVPLYPPLSMGNLEAWLERTARILVDAGARRVLASRRLRNLIFSLVERVPGLEGVDSLESLGDAGGPLRAPPASPETLCFLQYTSGSTADPKGVMITHGALAANAAAVTGPGGLRITPGDKGVSWLPLYHDMGLIGMVVAPVFHWVPIVFIPTLRFLKHPSVWMEAVHRHRATITFSPPFGYALAARKARDEELARWDLSKLRACGVGAEPIPPEAMRTFLARFAPCGVPASAALPAYGMAEATLAVSLKPVGEAMTTRQVDAAHFQNTGEARPPNGSAAPLEHVSCGPPFPGHEVRVVDEGGRPLPEGREGELCLRGPSVAAGYYRDGELTARVFGDGWLHTGDLGYLVGGEIYVTGRLKDLIILRGRNVHPQAVEWAAERVAGVRRGNVVAFSRPGREREEVVVVVETRSADTQALAQAVRAQVARELALPVADVCCLPPGCLPKTSSGKLQRRKTRALYLGGRLGLEARRPAGGDRITLARLFARSLWVRAKVAARAWGQV